jgi:hypothetical protein
MAVANFASSFVLLSIVMFVVFLAVATNVHVLPMWWYLKNFMLEHQHDKSTKS